MIVLRILRPDGSVSTVAVKPDPTASPVDRCRELLRRVLGESATLTPPGDDYHFDQGGTDAISH